MMKYKFIGYRVVFLINKNKKCLIYLRVNEECVIVNC